MSQVQAEQLQNDEQYQTTNNIQNMKFKSELSKNILFTIDMGSIPYVNGDFNIFVARDQYSLEFCMFTFSSIILYSLGFIMSLYNYSNHVMLNESAIIMIWSALSIFENLFIASAYIPMFNILYGNVYSKHNKVSHEYFNTYNKHMINIEQTNNIVLSLLNIFIVYITMTAHDSVWSNMYHEAPCMLLYVIMAFMMQYFKQVIYYIVAVITSIMTLGLSVMNISILSRVVENHICTMITRTDTSNINDYINYFNSITMDLDTFTKYCDASEEDTSDDESSMEPDEIAAMRGYPEFTNHEPVPEPAPRDPVELSNHKVKFMDTLTEITNRTVDENNKVNRTGSFWGW